MSWDVDLSWVGTSIYHDLGPRILSSLPACLPAGHPPGSIRASADRSVDAHARNHYGLDFRIFVGVTSCNDATGCVQCCCLFLGICFGAILPIIHPSTGTSSTGYCVWVQILIFWIHDNLWLQRSIFFAGYTLPKFLKKITSGKIKCFLRFSIAIIRPS